MATVTAAPQFLGAPVPFGAVNPLAARQGIISLKSDKLRAWPTGKSCSSENERHNDYVSSRLSVSVVLAVSVVSVVPAWVEVESSDRSSIHVQAYEVYQAGEVSRSIVSRPIISSACSDRFDLGTCHCVT